MNKLVGFSILCLTLGSVSAVKAETAVTWDQSSQPPSYADGAMSVTYDAGNVTAVESDLEKVGGISVSGGAMTLSPVSATFKSLSDGTLKLMNPVKQEGASDSEPAELKFASKILPSEVTVAKPAAFTFLLAKGIKLSSITNVTARFDKIPPFTTSGVPCDTVPCFWQDGDVERIIEFQKRTSSVTLRCVILIVRQNGDNIEAVVSGYRHISTSAIPIPTEGQVHLYAKDESWPAEWKTGYASSPGISDACFLTNLVVRFDRPQQVTSTVEVWGTNDLKKTVLKIGGDSPAKVSMEGTNSFPTSGSVEVGANGVLKLHVQQAGTVLGVLAGIDHGVPIVVREGGLLDIQSAYQLSASTSKVILDGGACSILNVDDSSVYMHNVAFTNGATMTGGGIRVRSSTNVWIVGGTKSSTIDNKIWLWTQNANNGNGLLDLNVADVTGDEGVDVTMNGVIRPSSLDGYRDPVFRKTGPGTARLNGQFQLNYRASEVCGGTLVMAGGFGAITENPDAKCDFLMNGGTLAFAANAANTVGKLDLQGNSGLKVEAGANVAFAAPVGKTWKEGAILMIDADLSQSSIRFGVDGSGLTKAQLRQLKPPAEKTMICRYTLTDEGYLREVLRTGIVVIFR